MSWVQRPRPGIPSYETNFAGPDRLPPANPGLWPGLEFSWHGPLGVTGIDADDAKDTSGNNNHGTPTNMVASDWVMTEKGYALDLNGTDQSILVPVPDIHTVGSLSVWFKSNTADQAGGHFIFSHRAGGDTRLYIRQTDTTLIAIYGGGASETLSAAIGTDWHHAVITWETGGRFKGYLDGQEKFDVAIPTWTGTWNQANPVLGKFAQGASAFWHGQITTVDAWSHALSLNEIQQLFVDPHAITRPMQRLFVGGGAAAANIVVLRRRMEAA